MNFGQNYAFIFTPLERFLRDHTLADPEFLAFFIGTILAFVGFAHLAGRRALSRLLPRLLILTSLVLVPLIFYRFNWQSYLPPKILVLHFTTALLFAVFLFSGQWKKPIRNPALIPLALLFLAWTVSSLRAANMAESVSLLMNYIVYFMFMLMCFHYARSIRFLRLCINLSCITQIAMSIFGMMQIAHKISEKYVFTHDQAVSTIGNVNFCSYYLDVVLPIAAAMLVYNFLRHRRVWLFVLIAAVEVLFYNYTFYEISVFPQFIAGTVVAYLLLSAMEWAAIALVSKQQELSLSAFLSSKLYTYSILLGVLHLFVIDSRGSHIGVLTCLIAMLSSWAYFQGAFDLTRLFQRKENFTGTPKDRSFNQRITLALLFLILGGAVLAGMVVIAVGMIDAAWGGRWLTRAQAPLTPEWFGWFSPSLFYIFVFGVLLGIVLLAWALVTWVFKQPGYAAAPVQTSTNQNERTLERSNTDRSVATAWAIVFGLSVLVSGGLIYLTYEGNARVSELHMEEGHALGSTLSNGEVVALPRWLDFWSSWDALKAAGSHSWALWIAGVLSFAAALLFIGALLPVEYTPENLWRTSVLLLVSGGLALLAILVMPLAWAYRLAFVVLLASFYLILYNAVRHVSLRRVEQSTTTHWLGMTALNTLLPLFLLATAMGFHHPTILKIWRGKLKDFSSTDLNTILFRFEIWKKSSRMIFDCDAAGVTDFANNNFLFGIGAGNFKVFELWFTALPENRVLGKEVLARDPHSYYLLVATEAGLVGVIAMFWLFLLIGRTMIGFLGWSSRQVQRTRLAPENKRMPRVIHQYSLLFYIMWGFFGAFMATVAHCAFEFNWTQPASAAMIYFVVAAALGLAQACGRKERDVVIFESPRQCYLKESPYTDAEQKQALEAEKGDPVEAFRRRMCWQTGALSLAGMILVVAVFHTGVRHFMGENFLKWGMIFEETDVDRDAGDAITTRYYGDMFESFRRAYALWPQQMEIFYILGRYHIDISHDIENLMRISDPTQQAQKVNEARAYGLNVTPDRLEEAMQYYLLQGARTHFVDLYMNPNYKWAQNNQGVTMDMLGRLTQDPNSLAFQVAREAYQKALIIDTEQIYALFNLGLGYMRQGQWPEAVELLERASEVDPSKPETFNELARAYANMNQYPKAQETLRRWGAWARERYKTRPREVLIWTNLETLVKLARLEIQTRRFQEASEYLEMAEKISPRDPDVQDLRAQVLFHLGKYGEASKLMEESNKRTPSAEGHYLLATCYAKMEKHFDAKLELQRAFSMNPAYRQQFKVDPNFEGIRDRSEYRGLVE